MSRPPAQSVLTSRPALRVVLTTVPPRSAQRIARALIEARVAACVQVVSGIGSVYRWRGRTVKGREALLVIKTSQRALRRCVRALCDQHPYEVPEVVVVTPTAVHRAYAAWAAAAVRAKT